MTNKRTSNQSEKLLLRSEEVQEILTTPPVWIVRWGITLIFLFVCIILALSFIIRYPDFVSSRVIITTKHPLEKIVAQSSGQLDKIFINNGDIVSKNQKVAIIKNTANFKDVYFLKNILDTIKLKSSLIPKFPVESATQLALGDIEVAYAKFESNYLNYYLLKELKPHSNEIHGNEQSLSEINLRLINHREQKKILEKEYQLKKIDFQRYKLLLDKGVISQQEFESKELEFLQIQKSITNLAITISQMREAITSANQTLLSIHIDKKEDYSKSLNNLTQSYNELKKSMLEWERKYVLKSSIDGVVSFQNFWGNNQYINSGDLLFSILPKNTTQLIGKLTIPSQNAGKVTPNQKVLIKLDNYHYQQFGTLLGKVETISISPNDDGNYIVYIGLPNGMKTSYNQSLSFKQELLGNAEIITEDLSLAQRFFYKFKDILNG